MQHITRRDRIRSVIRAWSSTYTNRTSTWKFRNGTTPKQILDRLKKLDLENCTREDVDEIIGNDSWTVNTCNECERDVEQAVTFWDGVNYIQLCQDCVRKASALFEDTP